MCVCMLSMMVLKGIFAFCSIIYPLAPTVPLLKWCYFSDRNVFLKYL